MAKFELQVECAVSGSGFSMSGKPKLPFNLKSSNIV